MFGPLGVWEIAFIMVLALLIFGPKKLPEVGRTIGRGMAEFRKATTDLKRTIEQEIDLDETRAPAKISRPAPQMKALEVERSSGAQKSDENRASEDASDPSAVTSEASDPVIDPVPEEASDPVPDPVPDQVKDALGS